MDWVSDSARIPGEKIIDRFASEKKGSALEEVREKAYKVRSEDIG